ncbi:nitroreductase family protein [Planktomarina temperata]|nr:nitroreductase family protein [Planktomarina temperata]
MRNLLSKLLPSGVERKLRIFLSFWRSKADFFYDARRFAAYSINRQLPSDCEIQLRAKITTLYHVIEKGLTMPNMRLAFGEDRIKLLISALLEWENQGYSTQCSQYQAALSALDEYLRIHSNAGMSNSLLSNFLVARQPEINPVHEGMSDARVGFSEGFKFLVHKRKSVREFRDVSIDINELKKSIGLALHSPSTCNRQTSRVYILTDKKQIQSVLELQGGSRGFSQTVTTLLIIGYDIRAYQGSGDRYTGYIDSSLFAMTLLYSLAEKDIATIPLNWSKTSQDDRKLRKLVEINDGHNISFFIAVGERSESAKIATSARLPTDAIIGK